MNKFIYYLLLFGSFGVFFLFTAFGWWLNERFLFFSEFWATETNRWGFGLANSLIIFFIGRKLYSRYFGEERFVQTITSLPIKKLSDCQDGELVRLQGRAQAITVPIVAPLSNNDCVAYIIKAFESEQVMTNDYQSKNVWEELSVTEKHIDFLLRTSDGYALLEIENAKQVITIDRKHKEINYQRDRQGFLSETENELRRNILNKMNIHPKRFTGVYAKHIKFTEGSIDIDEVISVAGQGSWRSTQNDDRLAHLAEQGIQRVYELKSTGEQQLIISDLKRTIDVTYKHD